LGAFGTVIMKMNLILFASLTFCCNNLAAQRLSLSTQSDSAIYYYYEGWRQVMDEGDYTASEKMYRKMMTFDPDFLVGLSLLGRITRSLNERQEIEQTLETRKQEVQSDERLLLDNYIGLVKVTNLREVDPEKAKDQLQIAFATSEKNLKIIVRKYPDEIYYRAEYIEVLQHNYGPRQALDTLYHLLSPQQQNEPFLLGYAANMEAESGNYKVALLKADLLAANFKDKQSPKPYVVYGDIYFKMKKYKKADKFIQQGLKLDPGNIDAQRLENKIEKAKNRN
jgi:tetratricopeptide (TPR) repeat protein